MKTYNATWDATVKFTTIIVIAVIVIVNVFMFTMKPLPEIMYYSWVAPWFSIFFTALTLLISYFFHPLRYEVGLKKKL